MAQPAVDVSSLVALRSLQRADKPDGVARIVSKFLDESAERLDSMQHGIDAGDPREVERAAHALKGIAGTVGANEVRDLAFQLEQLGREGHLTGAADVNTALQAAFARARPVFEELRGPT
jgi:HPt (histidine-containing phosphotransfer) domain-containing protein